MVNIPRKMDWELARTKTLLFYYEYMIRKGNPQKLTNLSCLFGEKDFTEDMRVVVGSSLAGLKILLSEHPSLFKMVDGDLVHLIDASESTSRAVVVERDCNEDTKEYFKHKLLSYGVGAEVPLKSLHGHRSQAPLPVRHICGVTNRDFQGFLSQYPETFQIVDKHVTLLGFDDLKIDRSTLRTRLPTDGRKINYFEQTPQRVRGNPNTADVESNGIATSRFEAKSRNLCQLNCPKISEVMNVYSPVQLCVGGIGSKVQVRRNTQIISTVSDSLRVTAQILKLVADTKGQVVISMGCKGSRTGKHSQMTLVEIGTPNGYAFLFDVLTCPQIMADGGLKEILENDRIVKVVHNCSYKSGNLYEQFNVVLRCVFDTQLANAVLQYQKSGTHVNSVKAVSLHQLIQLHCPFNSVNEPLAKSVWSARERPFTDEVIVYRAREVLALVQLYGCMALLIQEVNKPLLSALCTEEILMWIRPGDILAQQMEININFDGVVLEGTESETTTSTTMKNLRSVPSEPDMDSPGSVTQQVSTHRRCCDCYADKENQTLSTGDIVMLSKTYDN